MVKRILIWSAVIYCFAAVEPSEAQKPAALVERWTAETQLRLAQCFIAESDEARDDWTAVAYTMKNWLKVRRRRHPYLRYLDIASSTCSVHKLGRSSRSARQRWIRQLSFPTGRDAAGVLTFEKPEDFPRKASWKRKQRYWQRALEHASLWNQGLTKDPCKGQAVIWGAPRDPNNRWHLKTDDPILKDRRVVRLACSDKLSNDFYRLMTRTERAEHSLRLSKNQTQLPVNGHGLSRQTYVQTAMQTR